MRLQGFEILEKIGEGQMTVLWKARQISLDRLVSIRMLKPDAAAHPDEARRFLDEGRAAARVNHANTIQIFDVVSEDGLFYYVMEYVSGPTALQWLERHGPFSVPHALQVAACVGQALRNAWNVARMIHRNVKPANIHLEPDGTVKLKYLGLAWRVAPPSARAPRAAAPVEGTPHYMAPEQVRGEPLDCRTDMYGLGATLYHMITGHAPFEALPLQDVMDAQLNGQIPHPGDLVSTVPISVAFLITRLMMKRPEDRFRDWDQALDAIARIQSGSILVGRPPKGAVSTVAPPTRAASRRPARRPALTIRSGTTPSPSPRSRVPRRAKDPRAPAWFRVVAWALLLAWTALLAYRMAFWTGRLPRPPLLLPGPPEPLSSTAPMPEAAADESSAGSASARSALTDPSAAPMSRDDQAVLEDVIRSMLRHLSRWDATAAEAVVSAALRRDVSDALRRRLEELRDIPDGLRAADERAAEAIRRHLGRPMDIRFADGSRSLIPREVRPPEFSAVPADAAGSAGGPVTAWSLQEIHPAQRADWIGVAESPALATAQCLLRAKAGHLDEARQAALRAGLLATALQDWIRRQANEENASHEKSR